MSGFQDSLIVNFTHPGFCQAFQLYFEELEYSIQDWDGLFREMNTDGRGNRAFLRMAGEEVVGFIQFCPIELTSWFFTKRAGFVREFWIAPSYRRQGHGKSLLALAEEWFRSQGLGLVLLTTDTAPEFYQHLGYRKDPGFQAKNQDAVYRKEI